MKVVAMAKPFSSPPSLSNEALRRGHCFCADSNVNSVRCVHMHTLVCHVVNNSEETRTKKSKNYSTFHKLKYFCSLKPV